MNMQPTLTGSLLQLRPLVAQDFDELYLCASDPKIWEQHPQSNRYEKEIFKKFFDAALESRGAFAIIDSVSKKIIGSSRYYDFSPQEKRVNIGYTFLATSHWGGKFNHELKKLMLDHAFQSVSRVLFEIGVSNLRSRKAIEKIGARFLKNGELNGKPHAIYEMTSEIKI